MSKVTQKEAVFSAITNTLAEYNLSFEEGQDVVPLMNREIRSQVNNILVEGFKAGTIQIDDSYDPSKLKGYASSLQSNWIRKDKRLNGGIAYVAKNPGSRVGNTDASIKAMKVLLATLTSEEEKAEVQGYIDQRMTEINAAKIKATTINFDALPEALKVKFTK